MKENKANNWKKVVLDILFVVMGCVVGAFGSVGIMVPNGLTAGGLSGITRILQGVFPELGYAITFYALTIIVLIVVGLVLGKEEARKLALLAVLYPTVTLVMEKYEIGLLDEPDLVLAAIYYGVCSGLCSGMIFSRGYSLCASDAIAKMLRKKIFKSASLSKVLLCIDGAVIVASGFFYGRNVALYALISQVIASKVVDIIMYGLSTRLVEVRIITKKPIPVQDFILHSLGRGVSISTVVGAYTMKAHDQLMTYCSPRESVVIKQKVAEVDPDAFVSVVKVDTVWGQGSGFSNLTKSE